MTTVTNPIANLDDEQVAFVRDFISLFTEKVKQSTESFEALSNISHQEVLVLRILASEGPVMVKAIAQCLNGVSLSTLTRVLDRLEGQGYLTRRLNPQDRRSFQIALTAKGIQAVTDHQQVLERMAIVMLHALTPAERLMLMELYRKIAATFNAIDSSIMLTPE